MKFTAIAALIGVTAAVHKNSAPASHSLNQKEDEVDARLNQLMTTAFAGAKPGVIKEVTAAEAGTNPEENMVVMTEGYTKNYQFRWKYACAFTKWTPTNQWMHDQQKNHAANGSFKNAFDPSKMTLERFGFIGEDKKCYCGRTAVYWVTPLKVVQIKAGLA